MDKDETTSLESDLENRERRDFLIGLGKWSKILIGSAVLGGCYSYGGGSWINGRNYYGGGWINRRGGWINGRNYYGRGGWINRRGGGGWINGRRVWRHGGWINRRW